MRQSCPIDEWDFLFYLLNHRTPFELNTATRCALIVLWEALSSASLASLVCTVTSMLTSSMLYVGACLLDIKSIFAAHIDPLSKSKNSENSVLLDLCKEAVNLHERVIWYILLLHSKKLLLFISAILNCN